MATDYLAAWRFFHLQQAIDQPSDAAPGYYGQTYGNGSNRCWRTPSSSSKRLRENRLMRQQPHSHRRLRVEPLEDRRMLAVITVDTDLDVVDPADGVTSLREAVFAANAVAGADEIVFDFGVDGPVTILLDQGQLEITDSLTITGDGADLLTIDAGNGADGLFATSDGHRIFDIVDLGTSLTLPSVTIEGMTLTGGDISTLEIDPIFNGFGGAIRSEGDLSVIDSVITRNSASGPGGGIVNYGTLSIVRTTLSGNNSGAIFNGGMLEVSDSTISHNSSTGSGAAIENFFTLTISNSTLSGNVAGAGGGAIFSANALATIYSSTITENTAEFGGGIVGIGGQVDIFNSIVAGNTAVGGVGAGNNVVRDVFFDAFSLVDVDPLLGPLADHGGPTQTHALLPGSPALDAGDPSITFDPAVFDQRGAGFVRVANGDTTAGARIDIGAYESQGVPIAFPVGDFNQDGIANVADYTVWRDTLGQTVPFATGADADLNGQITTADYLVWKASFGNVTPIFFFPGSVEETLASPSSPSSPSSSSPAALLAEVILPAEEKASESTAELSQATSAIALEDDLLLLAIDQAADDESRVSVEAVSRQASNSDSDPQPSSNDDSALPALDTALGSR
ncbi:MAG: choice-of-anchor Q domain-containing protein [Planctomycetota bacterium]